MRFDSSTNSNRARGAALASSGGCYAFEAFKHARSAARVCRCVKRLLAQDGAKQVHSAGQMLRRNGIIGRLIAKDHWVCIVHIYAPACFLTAALGYLVYLSLVTWFPSIHLEAGRHASMQACKHRHASTVWHLLQQMVHVRIEWT